MLPALRGPVDCCSVRCSDLKDVLTHQGIEHRRFAAAHHAESRDLDRVVVELLAQLAQLGELAGQHGFFLGGQLEAGQSRFEAVTGALDCRVVFGGVRFELVE